MNTTQRAGEARGVLLREPRQLGVGDLAQGIGQHLDHLDATLGDRGGPARPAHAPAFRTTAMFENDHQGIQRESAISSRFSTGAMRSRRSGKRCTSSDAYVTTSSPRMRSRKLIQWERSQA